MVGSTWISSLAKTTAASINALERAKSLGAATRMLHTVSPALLVGISYYIGTRIGFAWTPSDRPNSTFWPPNAILLAALLLAPRRTWWTLLLAVFPAHMFAQLQTGVPVWTAVGWFISNGSEALIGAFCITRFTDPRNTLDSVRGVFVLVTFAAVIAPLATSFLDASAVIITQWGRGFWPLGIERFWTNALSELTIVPVVLGTRNRIAWNQKLSVARFSEAILLAIGTVLVAFLVFGSQYLSPATTPALLYLPLPLLLWAAARFGLRGLSLTVLSTALISMWYTMHGREPFPYASMSQNVLSLQILFCTVVVPLMFLSAVMAEARRTHEALRAVSSSLIEAQEQERQRIARDLHDDLGQRLALLTVQLKVLSEESAAHLKRALTDLSEQVQAISSTTHDISHGLYPSQLEYLGLAPAVKRLCTDMGGGGGPSIHLRMGDLPGQLQPSLSLCIYRVVQEAVHNIIKHSQAKNVQVEIEADNTRILVTIFDDGVGFDVNRKVSGLGISSMHQRVHSVGGWIDITPSTNGGTRVEVWVPLHKGDGVDAEVHPRLAS